jgi:CP family cyanate transporter-like MFS transporter
MAGKRTSPIARGSAFVLAGLLLFALNLRGPVIAVAPVVDQIRADLGISLGAAGLLTSLPVLCFSLTAPFASAVIGRTGPERAVLLSSFGILIGIILRSLDGASCAFVGTVVIGTAMTIGNVVVPVVIGRDFRQSAATTTGSYTAALNLGSLLTVGLTAPLAVWVGWRWALVAWSLPVAIGALLWRAATRNEMAPRVEAADFPAGSGADAPAGTAKSSRPVWGRSVAWGLTVAFACHTFSYYGVTAWLPKLLADEQGMSMSAAGMASSIFQVMAFGGSFGIPALVVLRRASPRAMIVGICAMWVVLPLGLLWAPSQWFLWSAITGLAQGAAFTVILLLVVIHSASPEDSRNLSAMVQGGGYVLGAVGPFAVGAVRAASGGWTWPLLLILGMIGGMALAGILSAGKSPGRSHGQQNPL